MTWEHTCKPHDNPRYSNTCRKCGRIMKEDTVKTVYQAGDLPETAKVLRTQDLRLPIHIATGRFEAATQEELSELITDLDHELRRREYEEAS